MPESFEHKLAALYGAELKRRAMRRLVPHGVNQDAIRIYCREVTEKAAEYGWPLLVAEMDALIDQMEKDSGH